jgi:catechol 2,3-dioxygenase-like lactoylglutathione lyase family enzyme
VPRLQHVSISIPGGTQEAVRAFYGGVLGLEEKEAPHALINLNVVWFAVGEGEMELHFVPGPVQRHPDDPGHICLVVDDLDDYRNRLSKAGYEVNDTIAIPNRPRFFSRDPFGNLLEFTTILGDYRTAQ